MDIAALQSRLRRFAAEREWQPFHTPKNLSTALLVEAAELAEIFQWMTPAESGQVAADPARRDRVGEEVADVLLYLLQLADHCGVDIEHAVEAKIVANARKYPGPQAAALHHVEVQPDARAIHVLIDYENVQPTLDEIEAAAPGASSVWVFHGPQQKLVGQAYPALGHRATPVRISQTGKNALDFHLSYYLGYLASRNDQAVIVVMANDTGYEPMLMHAREMGIQVRRVPVVRPARKSGGQARRSSGQPTLPAGSTPPSGQDVARPVAAEVPRSAPAKAVAKKAASSKALPRKEPASREPARKASSTSATTPPGTADKVVATKAVVAAKKAATPKGVARKAPAKKVAATSAQAAPAALLKEMAPRKPAARSVARPVARPVAEVQPQAGPKATPSNATAVTPTLLQHAIDSLRKMDNKRPVRLSGLRGALKSLLGAAANAESIELTIQRLAAQGYLDLAGAPKVVFPKFKSA